MLRKELYQQYKNQSGIYKLSISKTAQQLRISTASVKRYQY